MKRFDYLSLMMLSCTNYKNKKYNSDIDLEKERLSTPLERALKMPYNEFVGEVIKFTDNSSKIDFEAIAGQFEATPDDVVKRGQDLHLW